MPVAAHVTFQPVAQFAGYLASALVFAAFFMRSRTRLRQVAIVSNVAFIAYGIMGDVIPVLVLHTFLLPLNVWRLWEVGQTRKAMLAAVNGELRADWLEPFAREVRLNAGDRLFAHGELGDTMYFIVSGTVHLAESGIDLGSGSLVGEIAMFSPHSVRTQTATAVADSRLLAMSRDEMVALYRRHPEFSLYLLRLVTSRLLQNNLHSVRQASAATAREADPAERH